MMKLFELIYLCCEPGLPVLYRRVRQKLTSVAKSNAGTARILDVGGRKSHYTIGVPARITITDRPRSSVIQHQLHLGINEEVIAEIRRRRSNIEEILIDDMTASFLSSCSFDCAVAVEVLEHVDDDVAFTSEVRRVLKPNGVFLMTTPNGDFVQNTNPDHKRHYRRHELEALLLREFDSVDVRYAIPNTSYYRRALQSWSLKRPVSTVLAFLGSIVNSVEDRRSRCSPDGKGMQQLIAVAHKPV
jgi:SAM-dependent methyltransferase